MTAGPTVQSETALIIEDDDDIRRLLEMTIGQAGLAVESASTGQEGLDHAQHKAYSMITVDIGLPDINGLEIVHTLREHYTGPVVIISARSSDADRSAGLAAGADLFLTKPFRPRELRQQFASLLQDAGVR
ncbi:response regulator transcription factor [Enteractinococcus coprophilus]|uniref:Transcriptional regulator n=1 Tax=Enteractinococcus coprophilus TaxID=1027633 RepID=A0A543AGT9_9MICC|nr:response regulator [Enteractinococcus coprophilus]TQL71791.1 transcriptional regulator [Enteractinococcus coprophilus]